MSTDPGAEGQKAPGISESTEEAAEQQLDKASKIQTALEGVFVDSLRKIDQAERDAVNRYRDMKVFGGDGKSSLAPHGEGDIIVCDDMKIEIPQITPAQTSPANGSLWLRGAVLGASLLLGLGGSGLGLYSLLRSAAGPGVTHPPPISNPPAGVVQPAAPPSSPPQPAEWKVKIWVEEGKLKIKEERVPLGSP